MSNEEEKVASYPPVKPNEWKLLEKVLLEGQKEQRRTRRWGVFFKGLTFLYLFVLLLMFASGYSANKEAKGGAKSLEHVGLVELEGMILANEAASADALVKGLRAAFEAEKSLAVLMRINSPGGSPVQSAYVYNEIMRLREKHPEKKIYAVITDLGASGAYYIASAAHEIYADTSSLVGSIGVISASFGFTDIMGKLGVERRVIAAGDNKALMDPFLPLNDEEVEHFSTVLQDVHENFIDAVRAGRGERLKEVPGMFTGLVWSGRQALELGLVDGLLSPGQVAREKVGSEEMINYSRSASPFQKLVEQLGVSIGEGVGRVIQIESSGLNLR